MDCRIARHSAYLLIALLFPFTGKAQVRTVYTIQDCIQTALTNNIDVRNAKLDVDNARLNYRNSFGAKIPTLSLFASQNVNAGYTIDPFTNQFINQRIWSNNFSLNSNLTLFAGNQINFNSSRLKSAYSSSQLTSDVTRNQIMLEVAQYYTAVLSAYKIESAARSRRDKALQDRDRVIRRIDAKAAAKSDLADVDAQVATEELNLSRASGDIARQKLLLAQRMLIQDVNFDVAVPDISRLLQQLPDTNVDRVYQQALEALPDAKLARQNVVTSQYFEKTQRATLYPTIQASASLVTGYSSARTRIKATPSGGPVLDNLFFRDTTGVVREVPSSLFQNSTSYSTVPYPFDAQLSDNINQGVSITANIPILNRLQTKNNIDNARIQRLKAQNEQLRVNQTIYNSVASAIVEYRIAKANLEAAQRQVSSLQLSLQASKTRLEAGAGSSFDMLAQQQLFAASEASFVQQQFEVIFRRLVIDFYTGKPIQF